MDTAEHHFFF